MHAVRLPSGATMSVRMVCLGWHWLPYRYSRTADDVDGAPVTPFPSWLGDLGRRAVAAAYGDDAAVGYEPDVALVNRYDDGARMGMHQDRDERSDAPVVSLSIGDTCTFRFGNTDDARPPVHRRRAGVGRPRRVRRTVPLRLPRRAQGPAPAPATPPPGCAPAGSTSPCA